MIASTQLTSLFAVIATMAIKAHASAQINFYSDSSCNNYIDHLVYDDFGDQEIPSGAQAAIAVSFDGNNCGLFNMYPSDNTAGENSLGAIKGSCNPGNTPSQAGECFPLSYFDSWPSWCAFDAGDDSSYPEGPGRRSVGERTSPLHTITPVPLARTVGAAETVAAKRSHARDFA